MELFPIVDEVGNIIGRATREECHSGTFLLHPVVHLHVFNSAGCLYLQKRSDDKDIQPGKWDTSVGGHVDYGEDTLDALKREVREELGIVEFVPSFLFKYVFRSSVEVELVNSFYTVYDAGITPDPVEISDGRFWSVAEIRNAMNMNIFTPNFESEFNKILTESNLPFLIK